MSIAVAVRKGDTLALCADTQINFGDQRISGDQQETRKLRLIGDVWMASSGWSIYDNILDDFLGRHKKMPLDTKQNVFSFFMTLWKFLHDEYSFVNDQCGDSDDSPFGDLDAAFMLVGAGGIFHVASNMSVNVFTRYCAIGSGGDYSLGALHALYDGADDAVSLARRAVDAAIDFDVFCGGGTEVQVIRLTS